MQSDWLTIASSPVMWLIGFITAGSAVIQTLLMYRVARKAGKDIGLKEATLTETIKASLITSIGPCLGIFVGMTVLVIGLGGAVAFIRESAGVGSIMFELLAARAGAEAAGVELTREGMTLIGLATVLWTMALCSVEWVIIGGIGGRWLPKLKDAVGGGDPKLIAVVSVAIMLGAFGRMLITDSLIPGIKGNFPPLVGGIVGFLVAIGWIKWADSMKKPALKEYFMLVAILVGMTIAQLIAGAS